VTPALSAVYDELLARASEPPVEARARALREAFWRRTSILPPAGASEPEDRMLAAWDDALTSGGRVERQLVWRCRFRIVTSPH